MANTIRALYIDPPIAIARLGGSTVPMDSFRWVDSPNPHLQTIVEPAWTLDVEADGTVTPRLPDTLVFKDGELFRPVAPFFEVWALVGDEGTPQTAWQLRPLTPSLLAENGAGPEKLTFTIQAANAKAARRAKNTGLWFGTIPAVEIRGDHHLPVPLLGVSPPGVTQPMIPGDSSGIPLGFAQALKSRPQPAQGTTLWASEVDVEVIRFRFTPAKGFFYGPPWAARVRIGDFAPVREEHAFLNEGAGWAGKTTPMPWMQPDDTFDGAESTPPSSIGVVDDTCAGTITVTLQFDSDRFLEARANVFAGPPHFAPDRRPFLTLADEINDRLPPPGTSLAANEREEWVRDLFERIYETVSMINLDFYRNERATILEANQRRSRPIPNDFVPEPRRAMGAFDALRDPDIKIAASSDTLLLPLTERAKSRHAVLAELEELITLVGENPQRLRDLIRPPFAVARNEDGDFSTMQMPPFMRHSNANPLTLATWQYALLFQWVAAVRAAGRAAPTLSDEAERRRTAVLQRLGSQR